MVDNRVLGPVALVLSPMAHIDKGKRYSQCLLYLFQQLSVRQIILCFDGTGNDFHGGTRPSMREGEQD